MNHDTPSARRALLVASTGGHLDEMMLLERAFDPPFAHLEWATSDDAHSRSVLGGRVVHHVARVAPRDWRTALGVLPRAWRILGRAQADDVISTGAAIAVPFLVLARLRGRRAHYVESVTRTNGPSMTGRMVRRIPGVRVYTQHQAWADARWHHRGTVLDTFTVSAHTAPPRAGRVVVTLGTMRGYPFRRAVAAIQRALPSALAPDAEVLWQVGDVPAPGVAARDMVPRDELDAAMRDADLVIAHAGVGSTLQSLSAGRVPVLLVRRHAHGEHIDDHQALWAEEVQRRGLAVSAEADDLTPQHLRDAMARRVGTDSSGRFRLEV
ncbi:MAG: glycosyl transferase family 28 [Actinobacteria bacterium]|nr:glycosyl transferase family 28 [Actinomycetota bacterium]